VLWRVELPLAAPVIIAGIRTATVWVVGIATLATPVGQRCLGNYIFTGLQTRNWTMVMFGVVGAAVLAILLDLLIGGVQKATEERRRGVGMIAAGALLIVVIGGLVSPAIVRAIDRPDGIVARSPEHATEQEARDEIRIAGATSAAERLVSSMVAQAIRDASMRPRFPDVAPNKAFARLAESELDLLLDFRSAAWQRLPESNKAGAQWKSMARLKGWLARERGMRVIGPFGDAPPDAAGAPYELAMLLGPTIADQRDVVRAIEPLAEMMRRTARRDEPTSTAESPTTIRIGAKTFTEQYILAELIAQVAAEAGFETRRTESLGSTIVFNALTNGDLDVYVDYSGTIWANYMNREQTAAPWLVLTLMNEWLAETHDVRSLGSLGFENAYALVMRREQADELGIETIADLAAHAPNMTIGGDYEFFGRPEWSQIRQTYGLEFAEQTSYDSSIMYQAVKQGQVDVISAFSSDGRIAALDLVVLDDPQNVIPPYDAVLLLGPRVANDDRLAAALRPLVGAIEVDLMRQANLMVDRSEEKKTAAEAARWLRARERERQAGKAGER
jgi:glycine betaine/choline ABC-type transport system substrate-binding protein